MISGTAFGLVGFMLASVVDDGLQRGHTSTNKDQEMGQAKIKQRAAFAPQLIDAWEADDCVNFAVALARLTGWLLHVDWWSTSTEQREDMPVDQLKPLRVYVADNRDGIFDVGGNRSIVEFNQRVIVNLARRIGSGNGGVYTRFYGEAELAALPLRSQPDEGKIAAATLAIQAHPHFLASMPARTPPCLPAYQAARFTYGRCAAYAEAMQELTGLQPVALLAIRFTPFFEGTRRSETGYFHSVVLHPDGMAEDSWGKASLADIASRFGVIEFKTSSDEHRAVIAKIQASSAARYDGALQDARALIQAHRPR
jgi:hypothetical protein